MIALAFYVLCSKLWIEVLEINNIYKASQKAIYDYPIKKKIEDSLILLASIGVLLLIASIRMSPNQGPSVYVLYQILIWNKS